ncbi:MAG: hypothetical protein NFCOHLIN_00574 [Gammaproteobacteria bacterium]|nr:hypothetical protein [Gammaproteobacteria bacterium]
MKTHPSLAALFLGLAAAPVLAGDDCDAPVQDWQPRDAVMQMAAQQGWQVQRLKIDDGCYEIRGRDAQGRAFKARLDPQTLRIMKMKMGDRDHDRERYRAGERTQGGDASPRSGDGDAAPPAPGATPHGSIE